MLRIAADFLNGWPGNLRYARDYAAKRREGADKGEMSRLYVIESTPTITGANADHVWRLKPDQLEQLFLGLSKEAPKDSNAEWKAQMAFVDSMKAAGIPGGVFQAVMDLTKGSSAVIAGNEQPAVVHAFAHLVNANLGNVGKTVFYSDPLEASSVDQTQSLRELVGDIDAGKVETLIIIGGNPAYDTPIDLRLDLHRLSKVKLRAHLSLYYNETSDICQWHIPAAHYLESWGDTRAYDGTVTIVQPLIAPLYDGKTAHEMLALFSDNYDKKPYEIVKEYWRTAGVRAQGSGAGTASYRTTNGSERAQSSTVNQNAGRMPATRPNAHPSAAAAPGTPGDAGAPSAAAPTTGAPTQTTATAAPSDFEGQWRKWLHDGFIPNTALPTKTVAPKSDWASALSTPNTQSPTPNTYEVVFRPDPSIYDGRFANNGWLQELPKPLTKITWDNVALVSPNTAKKIGCLPPNYEEEKVGKKGYVDMATLGLGDKSIAKSVPVWILPGTPDDVITIHLGYGRPLSGRLGSGLGFNAYDIRRSDAPWSAPGAWINKNGQRYAIATTQLQFDMLGRDILRETPVDEYLKEKDKLQGEREEQHKETHELSLYQDFDYKNQGNGYAWGMSIDLNSCVGCNACMIACQAENNIPIVGKEQVTRGRSMHWIRVDAYFKGDEQKPEGPYFQPVPCMHCENAPCEPVCPVHATAHSAEGLNDMVYNRCVGTRYCSDNCPYKVRRFNFLLFNDWETPTYQLMRNPDVSVRSRGVMEKCTYCVQRIQSAKIQSELEGRPVRDGEIVTACQQVCPTEAIVFGNVNDPNSKVSKLKALERDYSLLGELNTRPRTTYLSALRNPNPEIKG